MQNLYIYSFLLSMQLQGFVLKKAKHFVWFDSFDRGRKLREGGREGMCGGVGGGCTYMELRFHLGVVAACFHLFVS